MNEKLAPGSPDEGAITTYYEGSTVTENSRAQQATEMVRVLMEESGEIADHKIAEMDPDARAVVTALARVPTHGAGNTEPQHKARAYLQALAHVQSNVEHAAAMGDLADRVDRTRRVGWFLAFVGVSLGAIEVTVAAAEYLAG